MSILPIFCCLLLFLLLFPDWLTSTSHLASFILPPVVPPVIFNACPKCPTVHPPQFVSARLPSEVKARGIDPHAYAVFTLAFIQKKRNPLSLLVTISTTSCHTQKVNFFQQWLTSTLDLVCFTLSLCPNLLLFAVNMLLFCQ